MNDLWLQIVGWCDAHNADYLLIAVGTAIGVVLAMRRMVIKPLMDHIQELVAALERRDTILDTLSARLNDIADGVSSMTGLERALRIVARVRGE